MKTDIKQISQCEKEINAVVDAKTAMNDYKKILKSLRPYAQIPGFRKGKAPLSMIDNLYGEHAKDEFIKEYLPKYFQKAIEEADAKPISSAPELKEHSWEKKKDFEMTFVYEVEPKIDFKEYKDLEVPFKPIEVTDEKVEQELKTMQEENAEINPSEEPVAESNLVKVNIETLGENVSDEDKFLERKVTVGDNQFGDDFDKAITGKSVEDSFETEIFSGENKRKVKVTVKEVETKEIPELNDEFAKEMDFDSLKALKEDVENELKEKFAKDNDRAKEGAILQAIIDKNPFELPQKFVEEQAKSMAERQLQMYGQASQDLDVSQFIPSFKPMAEQQIKSYFVTKQLIELENIEINDEDKEKVIKEAAEGVKLSVEEYKEKYSKVVDSDDFNYQVKSTKLFDQLKDSVKFVEPKEEKKETDEEKKVDKDKE